MPSQFSSSSRLFIHNLNIKTWCSVSADSGKLPGFKYMTSCIRFLRFFKLHRNLEPSPVGTPSYDHRNSVEISVCPVAKLHNQPKTKHDSILNCNFVCNSHLCKRSTWNISRSFQRLCEIAEHQLATYKS